MSRPPGDRKASFGLYLVTDRRQCPEGALVERVEAAIEGGVSMVQLREKDLDGRPLRELAEALLRVCRRRGVPLLVNDRVDVAVAAGADGVHLPGDSFRVAEARTLLGERALIGVSTHAPEEVAEAAAEGADFAVFGPVFETPSKAPYGAAQGLERLGAAVRAACLPVLAIGGMTPERATAARRIGAAGAAVISAILAAPDAAAAAREFVVARSPGKP